VSLREFQDSKGDVLHRYPHEDVRRLRKIGELRAIKFADQREEVHEEEIIVFEEEDDEDVTMLIDAL
jgi:hypothetical protein